MSNTVTYRKKHCYIFESTEFETFILVDDGINLTDSVLQNIATIIESSVNKYLHTEIDDWDVCVDDVIKNALNQAYGSNDMTVQTVRLGSIVY